MNERTRNGVVRVLVFLSEDHFDECSISQGQTIYLQKNYSIILLNRSYCFYCYQAWVNFAHSDYFTSVCVCVCVCVFVFLFLVVVAVVYVFFSLLLSTSFGYVCVSKKAERERNEGKQELMFSSI